jgi:hypothetical protein
MAEQNNMPRSQREKKRFRQEKRVLKKAGNKRLRRRLKQELAEEPETAHLSDDTHDPYVSSEGLNGQDCDPTRQVGGEDSVFS